ncbi:heme-binding domain-containing protein [Flavobacterium sp. 83]|uniref:heme-binding domain-containing protein n=1 Tax=Flavobacterium sp. 83 TaxID=1131812 RepID=UPI0005574B85|nr:heme-binding domain-containing protein [Flavobacterium sp. 83]
MKKSIKKTFFIVLIVFLLMQLYQPARNINSKQDVTTDYTKVYAVPKNVETILRTSCYDCHSNNTNYPLYSYVQPVGFFMESHIKEGKENLNLNEFGSYSKRKQGNKLDRMLKEIKSDGMPLTSYTLIHKNAILSPAQKNEVINWINKIKDSVSTVH